MTEYNLNWITSNLAVGAAPMSYEELDFLKAHGINAILNLCAEFCDLHQIEQGEGFEVYYLPVEDDSAPNMEGMEKALAWLDEAIYLGKKVLVHCRHGIGRTGTFVTAYLLRRGLGLNLAEKKLKNTRATPSSYTQWKLLKKYGKQTGELKIREPSLENKRTVELGGFFSEYEAIVKEIEEKRKNAVQNGIELPECGKNTNSCCHTPFHVLFIEAVYVNHQMGRTLTSQDRMDILTEAARLTSHIKKRDAEQTVVYLCPLNRNGACAVYNYRPMVCRVYGLSNEVIQQGLFEEMLYKLSQSLFFALSGAFAQKETLLFPFLDVISGRFVQTYFNNMLKLQGNTIKHPA